MKTRTYPHDIIVAGHCRRDDADRLPVDMRNRLAPLANRLKIQPRTDRFPIPLPRREG